MSRPATNSALPDSQPPLEVVAIERCRVCGGAERRRLGMAYAFRGREFPAVACAQCGIRFLAVQPAPAAMAELYGGAYFAEDFRCGRSDAHAWSEAAFRPENQSLLDDFERRVRGRRLLEVGAASGWLLRHAAERGWSASGVELSADAVAHARALGLDVFHGDLLQAARPAASADLIYLGDVLEHVPDCRAVMDEIARVLAPGGALYLRGPITTNSLARRMALTGARALGRTIVLREPPYHVWEFTPGSLRDLVHRSGLRLESLRQSKIPPGRPHGRKSAPARAALFAIDAINLPLTRVLNVLGDRAVLVARKP